MPKRPSGNGVLNSIHNSVHNNMQNSMYNNMPNSMLGAAEDQSGQGLKWLQIGVI